MSDTLWMLKGFYLPAAVGRYGPKVWRVLFPSNRRGNDHAFQTVPCYRDLRLPMLRKEMGRAYGTKLQMTAPSVLHGAYF